VLQEPVSPAPTLLRGDGAGRMKANECAGSSILAIVGHEQRHQPSGGKETVAAWAPAAPLCPTAAGRAGEPQVDGDVRPQQQ